MEQVIVECKDNIDTYNALRFDIDHLMHTNIYFKANIRARELIIPELNKRIIYVESKDQEKFIGRRNIVDSNNYLIKEICNELIGGN